LVGQPVVPAASWSNRDGEATPKAIGTTALKTARTDLLKAHHEADGTVTVRTIPVVPFAPALIVRLTA